MTSTWSSWRNNVISSPRLSKEFQFCCHSKIFLKQGIQHYVTKLTQKRWENLDKIFKIFVTQIKSVQGGFTRCVIVTLMTISRQAVLRLSHTKGKTAATESSQTTMFTTMTKSRTKRKRVTHIKIKLLKEQTCELDRWIKLFFGLCLLLSTLGNFVIFLI